MRLLSLACVLIAVAVATACGAAAHKHRETSSEVASLIRHTWGSTTGSPQFDYSCKRLDSGGRLFTCLAQDRTHLVKLASFDVVCDVSACRWTAYPSYVG